jgi:hypothetical protein
VVEKFDPETTRRRPVTTHGLAFTWAMSTKSRDLRCAACGRLIARLVDDQLAIKRADLQATIRGAFQAALVCSDRRCRHTTLVDVRSQPAAVDASLR